MTHPSDIPGLPPQHQGPNGQPRPMQIQLPQIAVVAAPNGPEPPLGPIPTSVTTDRLKMTDGSWLIALRLATAQGVNLYFLQPDTAAQVGTFLRQQAKAAKAGVELPPGAPLPDDDVDTGPVVTEACAAELRVKGATGDWVIHGCVNDEPGHKAHAVNTVPAGHPLAGFRWGKEITEADYVATVPAATDP